MDESMVLVRTANRAQAAGRDMVRRLLSTCTNRMRAVPEAARGCVASLAATAALSLLMLPLRGHLDIEASALVLVFPVILGAEVGGLVAGAVAVVVGSVAFDVVFVPPFFAVSLADAADWVSLLVYVIAMSVTVRVVVSMNFARSEARSSETEVRRLFNISELLVRESSQEELLVTIVTAIRRAFDLEGAALLLPVDDRLEVVASSGDELSELERRRLSSDELAPIAIPSGAVPGGGIQAIALVASGQAIGLLAVRGLGKAEGDRDLVQTFANHLALALERAQLRETAVRAHLLEEIDRTRRSLVGAVSHDFRTPLTAIKLSASTLLEPEALDSAEVRELIQLIEWQADRLNRMVSSVLDMTRIQSGSLQLRRMSVDMEDLVDEAVGVLGPGAEPERVRWESPSHLPPVDVDKVLVCQVLANLIDNATRYAPPGTPVLVAARRVINDTIEVSVTDRGAGVPLEERATIFQMFNRGEAGGRGGLGLAIAHAFVAAHGQRIWVEDDDGGGARFCFTLPVAVVDEVA